MSNKVVKLDQLTKKIQAFTNLITQKVNEKVAKKIDPCEINILDYYQGFIKINENEIKVRTLH